MSPSGRAGPVTGTNFALGSYDRLFQPVSEMRKGRISLLRVLTRNAKKKAKKANMAKKKIMTFAPVIAWLYHCS